MSDGPVLAGAGDRELPVYRLVMTCLRPVVGWWGRLDVVGLERLPAQGSVLLLVNHDSHWDPFIIGVAAAGRRQVRALAIAALWQRRVFAWFLDRMGQIPVDRGSGDADAMSTAIRRLSAGECIGIFPEGTITRGQTRRARSGAGRLALAVPTAHLVCAAVSDAPRIGRLSSRPRIRVEFFEPSAGQRLVDESAQELSARLLTEIRAIAPVPAR